MFTTAIAACIIAQDAKFLPTSTLFVDGLAIATLKNKVWTPISGPMKVDLPFKAYRLDLVHIASLTAAYELEFSDGVEGNFLSGSSDVLWSGPKPKFPRSIRTGNPDQSDYNVLVKDFVKSKIKRDLDFEIEISTIIRCDLDGDGQEEVLIEAGHKGLSDNFSFEGSKTGTMSCTLLRHIKNGKAITEPIYFFESAAGKDQEPIEISYLKSIADLDGDGNYEVTVSANYYEGQSATVYNLVKGQLKKLVSNGAGA